jgi:hypothetical protein
MEIGFCCVNSAHHDCSIYMKHLSMQTIMLIRECWLLYNLLLNGMMYRVCVVLSVSVCSVRLSVCLSVRPSVCLPVLPACLSACVCSSKVVFSYVLAGVHDKVFHFVKSVHAEQDEVCGLPFARNF